MSTKEKRIVSRSIQKHDLEVNWLKATTFIPYKGELIIYDMEVDEDGNTLKDTNENLLLPEGRTEPYTYARAKIGDGIHTVIALPFVDTTSLKYIEQELTEAQKTRARTNIGAASQKDIDKTIVGKTISYGSVIQNSNSFGGKKLYINSLDNVFASMHKKFWVMVTFHQCVDENNIEYPHAKDGATTADIDYWVEGPEITAKRLNFDSTRLGNLFDNNYDTYITIEPNTYAKIHIRFSNDDNWTPANATANTSQAYGTYPYGAFYISYYYDRVPHTTKRSHYRCFNNIDAHGHGYGWKFIEADYYLGDATSTVNVIEEIVDGSNLNRSCIEFIVFGTSDTEKTNPETWISQLEWRKDRVDFAKNSSILHNYGPNSVYNDMLFKTKTETNVCISTNGSITAKNISINDEPVATESFVTNYINNLLNTIYIGTDTPTEDLGENGDIYIVRSE